jgi:hypothetical protein
MWVTKTSQLMLYREIIVLCSEICTKHINALCGQKVEFFNVKPSGTKVTSRLYSVNYSVLSFKKVNEYGTVIGTF